MLFSTTSRHKIKTILTIYYVYYNRSFRQNLNHWLLEKSEMINLQMLIQKNTFNVLCSCCPFEKTCSEMSVSVSLPLRHFCTCKSLGSTCNPLKMSQVFHDPLICFTFYTPTERLTGLKLLKCALFGLRRLRRMSHNYFCWIFSLF